MHDLIADGPRVRFQADGEAVARRRWSLSHLTMALGGSAVVLASGGLAAGIAHGLRIGDPFGQGGRMLGAALVQAPTTWTPAGIAMLLFGLLPRLTALAWAAPVAFVLLGQLGELLQLDDWVRSLSPFAHVPRTLGGPMDLGPLLWLGIVTAVLLLAGMATFQ